MRNRFKPVLSTPRRTARQSDASANSEGNVSCNSSVGNTQQKESKTKSNEETASAEKCSEFLEGNAPTTQSDVDSAASKTSLPSSSTATGSQRRSRIKPTVASVARSRASTANKNKTSLEAKHSSGGTNKLDERSKEENLSVSQGHTSEKEDLLSRRLEFDEEDEQANVESVCTHEDRSQPVSSAKGHVVTSASLTNTELRSHPVAQETVIKPSQVQNKNTNSDNAVLQPADGGATPSLLRRKRVLPNLGSSARRRRSSVSKENVEKHPDLPEIRQEEIDVSHKDLGLINEESTVECSGSRSKRLRTLSEEDQNVEHATPTAAVPDIHDKEDDYDEEENKKKGLKRKRGGRPHKLKEPSDPSHMTMQHLIYFNPKTNPMTSSLAGRKRKADGKNKSKTPQGQDPNNLQDKESGQDAASGRNPPSLCGSPAITKDTASKEPSPDGDDTDGAAVAPRVKLAADGSIILDEESLLIPKSPDKTLEDSEIVYEDADEVNFGAYLKHRKVERWSLEETQRFYKALSQVGTDFSLMAPLFPNRKRRELKAKFKREEKQHRTLIEKTLRLRNPIDVELFTPKVDGEEIDDDVASTEKISSTHTTQEQ